MNGDVYDGLGLLDQACSSVPLLPHCIPLARSRCGTDPNAQVLAFVRDLKEVPTRTFIIQESQNAGSDGKVEGALQVYEDTFLDVQDESSEVSALIETQNQLW